MESLCTTKDHADEDDCAGGDVLPKGGDMEKHQRLLQRTEQKYTQESTEQAAASSEKVQGSMNFASNTAPVAFTMPSMVAAMYRMTGWKDRR